MNVLPFNVYPTSQLTMAVSPNEVPFGVFEDPLTGDGSPQSERSQLEMFTSKGNITC
jgi:hypothetical protein